MSKPKPMRFNLSWTRAGTSGNTDSPAWNDVQRELTEAMRSSGTTQLTVINAPEIGPDLLQVFCESQRFVIMLGENTINDHEVRTPYDADRSPRNVSILGNEWDNRTVSDDESFVLSVFLQFFETFNVAHDLLS